MIMLAERGSRFAAIAILIGIIAAIMGLFIYPITMGFSDRAGRFTELLATYQSNSARIDSLPELSREAERQSKLLSSLLIAAPDQEQAGETLREQIENAVEAIKGEVRASEVLAGEGGWARAAVACRISHSQLAALLTELQRQRPFIVVEAVSVTAEGALNNYQLDELDVRIETSAPFTLAQ